MFNVNSLTSIQKSAKMDKIDAFHSKGVQSRREKLLFRKLFGVIILIKNVGNFASELVDNGFGQWVAGN